MPSPLERAVEVMDRLRSPGGCPWDAEQTHESLTPYLLEEAYEVIEAIETGDLALLREELGDLLLQVLFHARITQELPPEQAFGIGGRLLMIVSEAVAAGVDPEAALRRTARAYRQSIAAKESGQ